MVHCDIWGPCYVLAYDGSRYFLTLIDDFSRTTWICLLHTKFETRTCIKSFYNMIITRLDTKIKLFWSDNGAKLKTIDFLNQREIIHQRSYVETPQQNGIVEKKYKHIVDVAGALHTQFGLTLHFLNDCILRVVSLINRDPTPLLDNKIP